MQTQGTGQGIFFNTDDMKPMVNNEAWAEAFEFYKETGKYGPPEELNHDIGDTRALVTAGRCALMIDWGDIGPLSIDATRPRRSRTRSAPSSCRARPSVLDWETGKLVDCTPEICPYAIDGVNHAPFAAFGGWSGAINARSDPKVIEAAYGFLSYMNQAAQSNVDVTIGWTGYNPYRISQFENIDPWVEAGFSPRVRRELSGRDRGQPEQPEHGVRPAHPRHPALRGRRARPRDGALPGGRDHRRGGAREHRGQAGRRSPRSSAATSS